MCSFRCFCADHQHSRVANDVQSLWPSVNLVAPNHQHYIHNFSILSMPFDSSTVVPFLLQALILKSELPSRVLPAGALGGRCLHSKASKSNIRPFCKMASSKPLLQKWNLAESWSDFDSHPQHPNHHHTFGTGILEAASGPVTCCRCKGNN